VKNRDSIAKFDWSSLDSLEIHHIFERTPIQIDIKINDIVVQSSRLIVDTFSKTNKEDLYNAAIKNMLHELEHHHQTRSINRRIDDTLFRPIDYINLSFTIDKDGASFPARKSLPEACICDPETWDGTSVVPPVCEKFIPNGIDNTCKTCEHLEGCHNIEKL
jgi:hypothetical protein